MQMNFRAVVGSEPLPTSAPLLPLFEAIINSIQSIEEAKISDGKIDINVNRDISLLRGDVWETDVDSFEIIDNGVGFNDKNYASFDIYGSDHKMIMGCKGVGRVLWLRAFSKVVVESTYLGDDGKFYERGFEFTIADETKPRFHQESSNTKTGTKIILEGYFKKYKNRCPKRIDTLAREIMNHCFTYLALDICPIINISDGQESRCINTVFKESIKNTLCVNDFIVNGNSFSVISAKNYAPSTDKHLLHYCAHKREVENESLSKYIKDLTTKLLNDDGEFTYHGYITGLILDENVNGGRTEFAFSKTKVENEENSEEIQLELDGSALVKATTLRDIISAVLPIVREFLTDEINSYNAKKAERIENYVYGVNPRYRSLLKHEPDCVNKIPHTSDDEKLELELFKQAQSFRLKVKQEQNDFARSDLDNIQNLEEYTQQCGKLSEKISDLGKDELAGYIMHRKVMLDILEKNLKYMDEEKKRYALEKEIHNIIFPMMKTSDEIDYNSHNLWIIDEQLAYHYYLASDKPISSYKIVKSDSDIEPDIVIFEPAFALTGDGNGSEINNITIIEFKRPGITDKKCVDQVVNYIKKIRTGKCKDKNGRVLAEMTYENVRFNCYIICDITSEMAEFLEGRTFKKTADGKCYYLPHDTYNAYIEVIPYQKMVDDSIKRNKILFDTLLCQLPEK